MSNNSKPPLPLVKGEKTRVLAMYEKDWMDPFKGAAMLSSRDSVMMNNYIVGGFISPYLGGAYGQYDRYHPNRTGVKYSKSGMYTDLHQAEMDPKLSMKSTALKERINAFNSHMYIEYENLRNTLHPYDGEAIINLFEIGLEHKLNTLGDVIMYQFKQIDAFKHNLRNELNDNIINHYGENADPTTDYDEDVDAIFNNAQRDYDVYLTNLPRHQPIHGPPAPPFQGANTAAMVAMWMGDDSDEDVMDGEEDSLT